MLSRIESFPGPNIETEQNRPQETTKRPEQSKKELVHFTDQDIQKINGRNQEHLQNRDARRSLGLAKVPESTSSEETYLDQAEKYIENVRKTTIALDNLEPNTEYNAELEKSGFPIGTAVDFDMLFSNKEEMLQKYPEKEQEINAYFQKFDEEYRKAYIEALEQNFNGAVAENTFKWEAMQGNSGETDYSQTDKIMEFLRSRPELLKNFRGHNIFWNRTKHLPEHLRGKSKDDIKKEILDKRLELLRRYPEIEQWDLLNEPLLRESRLGGDGVNQNEVVFDPVTDIDFFVELFKRAKEIAPNTKFYINEYNILSGEKTGDYIKFIQTLLEKGAPIDGIGVQGHITERGFASIEQMKQNLDSLSQLGLPITITEFDVSDEVIEEMYFSSKESAATTDKSLVEKARADYIKKAMTIFYGNPQVNGVYFWGIQDKSHWRGGNEHVGLFDDNFQPNEVGKTFQRLVQEDWATAVNALSNNQGQLSFTGFPGKYKIQK